MAAVMRTNEEPTLKMKLFNVHAHWDVRLNLFDSHTHTHSRRPASPARHVWCARYAIKFQFRQSIRMERSLHYYCYFWYHRFRYFSIEIVGVDLTPAA